MMMTEVNRLMARAVSDQLFALRDRDSGCTITIGVAAIEGIEKVLVGLSNDDLGFAQVRSGQLIRGMRDALSAQPRLTGELIALGGRLRSGKDAFADELVERFGYTKLGMSDVILEHMLIVDPWIRVTIREGIRLRVWPWFRRASWLVDRLGFVDAKSIADFRAYMQRDGSEGGREFFGQDIWVSAMRERVASRLAASERVVLTGIRIPNELSMVRDLGGVALWVSRPSVEATPGTHATERSLGAHDFDHVVDNSGTLNDLRRQAGTYAAAA